MPADTDIGQLTDERLWEQYSRCIEEYRFQVNLNWSRSQYFFVLNVALLVAGVGLLSADVPAMLPAVVFVVGTASAAIAILASTTQHDYYKNVRDLKEKLEARLKLGELALTTTWGMGGIRERVASLTTFQKFILGFLLVADLTGVGVVVYQAVKSDPPAKVEVVLTVVAGNRSSLRRIPVVLSRDGRIVASAAPRPGGIVTAQVPPGDYEVSASTPGLCRSHARVATSPLQRIVVRCP